MNTLSTTFSEYNENCSLQEVEIRSARYLKYSCFYDNIMWYRCPHTNHYYGIVRELEDCYLMNFDTICPDDTHFYQACGHGGCAGYEVWKKRNSNNHRFLHELSAGKVDC